MKLLDGKTTAANIKARIASIIKSGTDDTGCPHLAAILVGDDGASETYVASKVKACEQIGFKSSLVRFPAMVNQDELLSAISDLNENPQVHGIIVQLPLPSHIDEDVVAMSVSRNKDVDGFHPESLGRLMLGLDGFISATPKGIMILLEEYGIETAGKHCVVVGRSNIVGTPMSVLMSRNNYPGNCTVTLCHSRTPDLGQHTRQADILIVAMGKPGFISADMVKEGAVVIDVGITRVVDASTPKGYRIMGDVDFEKVAPITSWITPVPGGVGAMTIAALMQNTLEAWQKITKPNG